MRPICGSCGHPTPAKDRGRSGLGVGIGAIDPVRAMTIPTYDTLMLPLLRRCAERPWNMQDLTARMADEFKLTDEERGQLLPSGGATTIASRVGWARTYLKKAGLVEQPKRGIVQISERGRAVLNESPPRIDIAFLQRFDEFNEFRKRSQHAGDAGPPTNGTHEAPTAPSATPEEQIGAASGILEEALREALLVRVREAPPAFFERLIVDLLLKMGYGGSRSDAGEHLGKTGDGGIDGVIREDQLGLDRVYLQAKRYQPGNTVGSEMVQAFIGALIGKGASKGVLITTSTFSKAALGAAGQSGSIRLVLIDGDELAKLMIRFNVGVRVARTVEIKRIDVDYFGVGDPE